MASFSEIIANLQNGVNAIRDLTTQLAATFPQVTALSTTAPTGSIAFNSSQAETFLTVISASGVTYKVALYL